ncbi:MAG: hypothetical protein P8N99_10055, partial [Luminiphilus sp.]|nr:hypothetical protein [Luminiphilus sp.]
RQTSKLWLDSWPAQLMPAEPPPRIRTFGRCFDLCTDLSLMGILVVGTALCYLSVALLKAVPTVG